MRNWILSNFACAIEEERIEQQTGGELPEGELLGKVWVYSCYLIVEVYWWYKCITKSLV